MWCCVFPTMLLLSIPSILELAGELCMPLAGGMFIFTGAQPAPHMSFSKYVDVLKIYFGGNAYLIGDPAKLGQKWHI